MFSIEKKVSKITGEFNGWIGINNKGFIQITLLNGDHVIYSFDQKQFSEIISKLKKGDLIRLISISDKNTNLKSNIDKIIKIWNVNNEFTKTFNDFKLDFKELENINEDDIKILYEVMKSNYSALLLMGEN